MFSAACSEEEHATGMQQGGKISFTVDAEESSADVIATRGVSTPEAVAFKGTQANRPLFLTAEVTGRPAVTRGTRIENATQLQEFGVSAIKTNENVTAEQFAAATPDFFYKLRATKNGSGVFDITQDYYWPTSNEKLFFYAYAPYDDDNVQISDQDAGGAQKVTFTVDTNVGNQVDLMTASAETTSFHSASGDQKKSSVGLSFKHELTAVRFVIGEQWLAGRIKSVGIYNVHGKGTMTIGADDDSKWEWKNKTGLVTYSATDDFVLTVNKSGIEGNNNEEFIDDNSLYFLMIPQSFDGNDDAYIEVKYQDLTYEYTVTAPLKGQAAWQRNTTVTYAISSHELTKLKISSISWPSSSASDAWQGPKMSFANGDAVGLYVVDTDGETILHRNVQCTYNNGSWTVNHPANSPVYALPGREYFFYYPYTANPDETKYPVAGQGAPGATAGAFFSTLINGWSPALMQNGETAATLNAQDLQVGKGEAVNGVASTISATMAHQMNIAVLTLGKKTINKKGYNDSYKHLSSDSNYKWLHSSTFGVIDSEYQIWASSSFTGDTRPYRQQGSGTDPDTYYFVFKPVKNMSSEDGIDLSAVQGDNVTVDWTENFKTTDRGKRFVREAASNRTEYVTSEHKDLGSTPYSLAVGDIFYNTGAISKTVVTGNSCYEKPVGIVFMASTSSTDTNAGYKHGYVLAVKDAAQVVGWMDYASSDISGITNITASNASQLYSRISNLNTAGNNGRLNTAQVPANSHYPPFKAASDFNAGAFRITSSKTSGWYVPSIGEWWYVMRNLGGMPASYYAEGSTGTDLQYTGMRTYLNALNDHIKKIGGTAGTAFDYISHDFVTYTKNNLSDLLYWSSTEMSAGNIIALCINDSGNNGKNMNKVLFYQYNKYTPGWQTRCVLAF